jgi:hypothetical protein
MSFAQICFLLCAHANTQSSTGKKILLSVFSLFLSYSFLAIAVTQTQTRMPTQDIPVQLSVDSTHESLSRLSDMIITLHLVYLQHHLGKT